MIRKRRRQLAQFYVLVDMLAISTAFFLSFWLRFCSDILGVPKGIPDFRDYLVVLPALLLVHMVYFSLQGFYRVKLRRNRLDDLFLVMVNAVVTAFFILLLFSYLSSYSFVDFEVSHTYLLVYAVLAVFLIFTLRLLVFRVFRSVTMKKNGFSRVLIAGAGELGLLTAEKLRNYKHFGIQVCGFLNAEPGPGVHGEYRDLERVVRELSITDLFIALPLSEYATIMELIEKANSNLIDVRLIPDLLQMASLKAGMEHLEGIPVIHLGDIPLIGWRAALKRAFDLLVSSAGLVCTLPLLALLALIVKIDSSGPVFFRQKRVGLDGRVFKMVKFRTMIKEAEKETGAVWSPPNDQRVTRSGRVMRRLSLDELPQLWNVITGDMSLVGPRPERPEFVDSFKEKIPRYMLRHRVKTGMTGWAQVHGLRGNTSLDKRIEFDIYYIQNWTFMLDLGILWRTLLKLRFIDRNA